MTMNENQSLSDSLIERTWQQSIDCLVDGELTDAEARSLLAMLDGVEGGWRRLALAYVEAQSLRGDLPSLTDNAYALAGKTAVSVAGAPQVVARKPSSALRLTLMTLAVAASMLVAFTLSLRRSHQDGPEPAGAGSEIGVPVVDNSQGTVPQPREGAGGNATAVAVGNNEPVTPGLRPIDPSEPQLVVIGSDPTDPRAVVPSRVIDALRRSGHRVDQRSGVMPVRLQDGRKVNVPYDQLDVQFGGAASFQ